MIREIAKAAHPGRRGARYVAVLTFKFDESYNNRTLTVGGWLTEADEWKRLEDQWQKRIEHQNRVMSPEKRITRFHASHMNCYDHEFENWDKEETKLFSEKLLAIIQRRNVIAISCGIRIDDFFDVFVEKNRKTDMGVVYALCMKQVMVELAHALDELPTHKIFIIHDTGNWDVQALQGYNSMVNDLRWQLRDRFVGITPGKWQDHVGLQASDLIAYETFKHLDNKLFNSTAHVRPALRALLPKVPLRAKYWDKPVLTAFKKLVDETAAKSLAEVIPEASTDEPKQ